MSAKGCIFPETETLFRFEAGAVQSPKSEVTSPACVLFGIRPCDAMAFTFLDRVFDTKDYKEPRYLARRSVTLVATLACSEPGPACFCTSVNCAPDSEAGADIAMFELADKYLVKSVTEAGKRALEALASMLTEATKADLADRDQRAEDAKKKLTKAFDASALSKKLDDFHASFWDKLHQKCLGCAVCTYFCPTCHCFDITDETLKSEGRRVRTWDSCMFPLFALHASGHNPRPTLKERMRQRIMHKFNYAPKNYGQVFCVGCGRCVANCPVGIDIRAVLSEIAGRP
jgi:formate hydrogenlyase subunit 6/NADH:ubiquinone oxidoreductase subunit I